MRDLLRNPITDAERRFAEAILRRPGGAPELRDLARWIRRVTKNTRPVVGFGPDTPYPANEETT